MWKRKLGWFREDGAPDGAGAGGEDREEGSGAEEGAGKSAGGKGAGGAVLKWGDKMLTVEEAQRNLKMAEEKARGADKALRERAEAVRERDEARRIVQDIKAANKGDFEAARRLATYDIGVTAEQVEELERLWKDSGAGSGAGEGGRNAPPRKVGLNDLDNETRQEVLASRRKRAEEWKEVSLKTVDKALDSDEVLGDIVSSAAAADQKRIRTAAQEALRRRVHEAVTANPPREFRLTADVLQSLVQEIRGYVSEIGLLPDGEDGPITSEARRAGVLPPTLGASPGGAQTLHRKREAPTRPKEGYRGDQNEMADYATRKIAHIFNTTGGDDFGG